MTKAEFKRNNNTSDSGGRYILNTIQVKIMRKKIFVLLVSLILVSCYKESFSELKKESFEDVLFYLSKMKLTNSKNDLHLIGIKKIKEKDERYSYEFTYQIKEKSDSLCLIQYCDVETKDISFDVELSKKLYKYMDSINAVNLENKYYPLHKRWDWITEKEIK
jgi:hypothetical protein